MMNFGQALEAMKAGRCVARSGWNGKGMFLFLVPGSTFAVSEGRPMASFFPVGTQISYHAHIDMKAADGSVFAWNPNNLDLLADDWNADIHSYPTS